MSEPVEGTRGQTPDDIRRVAPVPTFAAGETVPGLSSWVLERKLGGGGFGEVWLAKHALDAEQKPRAVKFCTDPAARHRLVTHEKNVVARVMKYAGKHPNIVPLLDYNLDGDIPWLMYEFVEGGTLAKSIEEWQELPLPKRLGRAVRALHGIASGLAACHRLDPPLVHRDMKPHNVLMAGNTPRITDFGIGSVVMPQKESGTTGALTAYAARLPSALHNAGTRLYAPPEQMFGSPPNPRDDVYALGIIAYQTVTGDLKTAPGADANLELCRLKVPAELMSLIVRSVAMHPDRRPTDAREWETALASLLQKSQKQAAPTTIGSKPMPLPEPAKTTAPQTEEPFTLPPPKPKAPPTKPARRRLVAVVTGSTLALGLLVAVVVALLPSGKRTEPSTPEHTTGPNVNPPDTKGTQPKSNPPAPKIPIPLKGGDTCEVEIAAGTKMTFCWIPPGECQLGFPPEEAKAINAAFKQAAAGSGGKQLQGFGRVIIEDEKQRGKFYTDGFWLGKYEVTQAEWTVVMGSNPSWFRVGGKGTAKLSETTDTSRFPVESVSWEMITEKDGFLDKVSAHGGIEKAFGKPSRFKLPHEDEWEYACRGGLGNRRPFYFGNGLSGTQANMDGRLPMGTNTKGPNRERPLPVGSYEAKFPHPWGLCDIHGNVREWCSNPEHVSSPDFRVNRGGAWCSSGIDCRSASRASHSGKSSNAATGFRLCFLLN